MAEKFALTFFVRSWNRWGMASTPRDALSQFLKAGGEIKDLVGKEKALTRVRHLPNVLPYLDDGTIQLESGTDAERRQTSYSYATFDKSGKYGDFTTPDFGATLKTLQARR